MRITSQTVAVFPELASLTRKAATGAKGKYCLGAGEYSDASPLEYARPSALLLPRITDAATSSLEPVPPCDAALHTLPENMPFHDSAVGRSNFALLARLFQTTPAYRVRMGRDMQSIEPSVSRIIG